MILLEILFLRGDINRCLSMLTLVMIYEKEISGFVSAALWHLNLNPLVHMMYMGRMNEGKWDKKIGMHQARTQTQYLMVPSPNPLST